MKPIKVTDVEIVFGGKVDELLPPWSEIPKEFQNGRTKWNQLFRDWMFSGLKNVKWEPKDGINTEEAVRHVSAVMRSFKPSHEHKEAGCAYLLSLFFNEVKWVCEK